MKILYFTNVPSPYTVDFLNELSNKNDVTVLFDYGNDDKRNNSWYVKNNYKFKHVNLKNLAFFQLHNILKENFDIYVIGTYACINGAILNLLLKKQNKKFFINADGGFIDENDSFLSRNLKTFFISKASYYISSGKETDKYLIHYGANKRNIYHIPFTSLRSKDILDKPLDLIEKQAIRENHGYKYSKIFVSVGSLIHRKGFDILIEAIKKINNNSVGFIIVGEGPEEDNLKKLCKSYNLHNVEFVGYCDKEATFEYMKMADSFVFTSREDIWGLVINEAMANGLPVISSSKVNAAKELIEKGYIYEVNDINSLCSLIKEVVDMSYQKEYKIGNNNLAIIKDYTIENMANTHNDIFMKVLKNE